jgi:hypothetical protein
MTLTRCYGLGLGQPAITSSSSASSSSSPGGARRGLSTIPALDRRHDQRRESLARASEDAGFVDRFRIAR